MKTPPVPAHDLRSRFRSFRFLSRTACRHGKFVVLLAGSSLLAAGSLRAVNTEFDVASEPMTAFVNPEDLRTAATYTNNATPTTTSDITFNATNFYSEPEPAGYTPALGVFSVGGALSIGTLNDLSTSQAITLTNGNVGTQAPLTLNGGGNTVPGSNTADLLYVATGATLNLSNIKPNTGAVGNTLILTLATSGNFDVAGTATISVPIASGTQAAPTANAFGFTKTGAGTLFLTNNTNNFTGGTTVNAGTLNLGAGNANGTGVVRGTLTVNAGANLILSGNNALGFAAGGASVTTLNVNGGTVDTTVAGAANNQGFLASFNLTGATVSSSGGATYNFAAGDATAPGITSNASATTSTISGGVVVRSGNLGFNVASGTAGTANGSDLTVSGVISSTGAFGIAKNGAGTMMLSAVNTYTGTTTVNAGRLFVTSTGSTATGSAVTVNNAGTVLGGTGIIGGAITVGAGAILSAGNKALPAPAIGILTTGAVTLQLGSTFDALLSNSGTFSTLNAVGTTALGGAAFTISLTPGATFTNNSVLQLITSAVSGTFTNPVFTAGGYAFKADYTTDPGFFDVDVTAVPEPSTWIGIVTLAGLFGIAHRRRVAARLAA